MSLDAIRWAFKTPIQNPGAKFVLVALAEHARDEGEGWTCFPSIKRLGRWTSQGERTIERHLSWLVAQGWVSRQSRRRKREGDSAYFYTLHPAPGEDSDAPSTDMDGESERKSAKVASGQRLYVRQSGADRPPLSTRSAAKTASAYIEEPVIEPVNEPNAPEARDTGDRFAEFWSAYPNKVEERGAKAIFLRLVRRRDATPDELVSGARRYAALVRGRDRQFVKSPASWLSKGCWADDAPPVVESAVGSAALPAAFEGPADVWASVTTHKGPAWAMSYLAPCTWSAASRALRPRTAYAARKLRDELGGLLRDLAVAIIEPASLGGAHAC